MALLNPFTTANKGGIPRIESNGVSVSADRVTFSFSTQMFLSYKYNGLVAFKIAQPIPAGTTTSLPIYLGNQPLLSINGTAVTASSLTGTGILLCWYDSAANLLQVINLL